MDSEGIWAGLATLLQATRPSVDDVAQMAQDLGVFKV
jgi:hypothetical protein